MMGLILKNADMQIPVQVLVFRHHTGMPLAENRQVSIHEFSVLESRTCSRQEIVRYGYQYPGI